MRAYFFGNMYLSSIQQGIQALHATSEMFVKYYGRAGDTNGMLMEWAENHKTVCLMNGGFNSTIRGLMAFFNDNENAYPWAEFHEEEDSLDGALTCVGIILSEKIYDTAKIIRNGDSESILKQIYNSGSYTIFGETPIIRVFTKWEFEMLKTLNTFGLAK